MDKDEEIKKCSNKLEALGKELSKIQYDFKIKNTSSEKYWNKKILEFHNYHSKTLEYFTQGYSLIKILNKEQSGLFLLNLSKLKQLGNKYIVNLEKIKNNPSIMDIRDRQQSKWSISQKEELMSSNKKCLDHERQMNIFFREFCEKNLKIK